MTQPDRGQPDRARDDRLSALLEDAVSDVHPEPALDRIRARTQVVPMSRRRPWLLVTAGAVAATAATVVGVALLNGRSPGPDTDPGVAASATATPTGQATAEPSPEPSESPSAAASTSASGSGTASTQPGPAGGTVALPVYFVGETPTGPRLYREFHDTSVGAGWPPRLLAALKQATEGDALDPDYRSGWPSGFSVVGAGVPADGTAGPLVLAVESDGDPTARPAGMTEKGARLAIQQLVYTAQAVVQDRQPVRFTRADGTPLTRLLGLDVTDPVTQADALTVQAPVWVTSPQDGDEVGRTFTVQGRGAFFEATVSWQLLRADGTVAKEGFGTAQECCTLSPYSFKVTAEPGEYVLRVYDADVSGGEGPGEQEDTKRITVR